MTYWRGISVVACLEIAALVWVWPPYQSLPVEVILPRATVVEDVALRPIPVVVVPALEIVSSAPRVPLQQTTCTHEVLSAINGASWTSIKTCRTVTLDD